jgi:transposase
LVVRQAERIDRLETEVAELKRQLGQNSRNSSRPPSSDSPFAKPAPKSLRRRSGRKPGGHPGSTLALVADPHERERHEPGPCTGCGADLVDAPEVGMERRQVFDLPPMTVRVAEHQLIPRRCSCGATTCGVAPEGVTAPVQYGPRITAIILYLYVGQFLSKNAQRRRWPSCSAPRSPRAPLRPCRSGPLTDCTTSWTWSRIASLRRRWLGSTRPAYVWPGTCTGCTAPAPTATP